MGIKTVGVPHLGRRHHVVRPEVEAQQGVGQMLNQQLGPRLQLLQKQLRQPQEGQQKNFQQKNQEDKQQELVPDRAQVLHPQKLLAHLESLGKSYPKRKKTKQPQERQILVFLQLMWTAILFLPLMRKGIQFLENKDKTIDDILVDKWKEKCSGGISTKNKRKRCVSDALADSDDDTPEEKQVKDALKSLLEEDSDKAYEFLSTSSSRTFGEIEKEEETQENSTPENSNSSRNPFRKFKLPKKKSKSTSTSGNSGSSRNPLRKFKLPKKKVKPTPSPDSSTDEVT